MPLTKVPALLGTASPLRTSPRTVLQAEPVYGLAESAYPTPQLWVRQIATSSTNASSVTATFAKSTQVGNVLIWAGGARTSGALTGSAGMVDEVMVLIQPGITSACMAIWMGQIVRTGTTASASWAGSDTMFIAALELAGAAGVTDQATYAASAGGLSVTPTRHSLYFNFIYCNGFVGGGPSQTVSGGITFTNDGGRSGAAYGIVQPGYALSRAWSNTGGGPLQGVVTVY